MENRKEKPLIAITMGDPAGIGPEIVARLLTGEDVGKLCHPIVIGDLCAMEKALLQIGSSKCPYVIGNPEDAVFDGRINLLDLGCLKGVEYRMGEVSAACGEAAFRYVEKAIQLAINHQVEANVTAPLNKEAMNLAGHHFSGHTEIYAAYTGIRDYAMMLAYGDMRVVHVSTHVSLRQACDCVKRERVLRVIELADQACRDFGIEKPKIAVAGLNPHCGENGLFGKEEEEEIGPAVHAARKEGIEAFGPIPADTVFCKQKSGMYDISVCMYHDQGHIPVKLAGFTWKKDGQPAKMNGINITLGLPVVRISVDHGTAFDIAGKNIASEESLAEAVRYAAKMVNSRKETEEME